MTGALSTAQFSEAYAKLRGLRAVSVREAGDAIPEEVVQCVWYDQLFRSDDLRTVEGTPLKVVSPGWWNKGEGPDFKVAQIEFNGKLRTGDVEVHLQQGGWRAHGHDSDPRYDDVMLHVVLEEGTGSTPPQTSRGRSVQTLYLSPILQEDIRVLGERLTLDHYPLQADSTRGECAALVETYGSDRHGALIHLAGEWRMLFKARLLEERAIRAGLEQALYETVVSACGFSHFKHHFQALARQLPYARAQQLAQQDALQLEAAYLQLAGLLPDTLPEGTTAVPHFARLRALRRDHLSGLRSLPLVWKRTGVRPNNNPERRLAGAARFIAKTASAGLCETLDRVWQGEATAIERRRSFEDLFPAPMGFWSEHCTWTGKKMAKPSSPIGAGRARSIIGNVFVPLGLTLARQRRDLAYEQRVFEFFRKLPREPENKIERVMLPRIFGATKPPRLDFRTQQGLLQMHQDWCEMNPSCRNCRVLEQLQAAAAKGE